MTDLTDLPNNGEVAATTLKQAGIRTPSDLRRLGGVGAAMRLVKSGCDVCSSRLFALEGAVRGFRWHSIPAAERAALRAEFDARRRGRRGAR